MTKTPDELIGAVVGCFYRWPHDAAHPDCWQPPLRGVVLSQYSEDAWRGCTAFAFDRSTADKLGISDNNHKLEDHVRWCRSVGLLNDIVPIIYNEGQIDQCVQWDKIAQLLPFAEMVAAWERARAARYAEIDSGRKKKINDLRKELRQIRKEMKEKGIKRTSCFNRCEGNTYSYNASIFRLEVELERLVGDNPTAQRRDSIKPTI